MNNKGNKNKGLVRLELLPATASELRAHKMLVSGLKKENSKKYLSAKQRAEKSLKTMREIIKKLKEK